MIKEKIIDVCDSYNAACSTCAPMTDEDRRRHIIAYKYDIELKDEKHTQKQIQRAEHFNVGDIVTCLDTGFKAEILSRQEVKEKGFEK